MTAIVPAPVSLFGAPLDAVSVPSSATGSTIGLAPAFMPMPGNPAAGTALSGFEVTGATGAPSAPFADLVAEAIGQVEHLEQQAQASIEGLISGKGVDVHEAMIAAQKAGMGFELVLAVRNKALAAYQQVLGMQF